MRRIKPTPAQVNILKDYGLSFDELTGIDVLEYSAGEFICTEGQLMPNLLFVLGGNAKVYFQTENGKSLLLCFYHAGGIIGDIELMQNEDKARTSVQAVSGVKCISVPTVQNRTALFGSTAFLQNIGVALARKLDRCTKNCAYIILYPLESRLCSYIEITNKNGYFADKLTETAELLGTSYRHLLRSLQTLCTQGILKKEERGYRILNLKALSGIGKGFYEPVES